ncbi:MAG: hypothetical protein RSG52_12920 [Terrisporobacter sp.]|uniref:hypothetical protein n=1 Tax=Terrisporobacter sp. TaxID=1965305 RepID=UPI002FC9DC23
MRYYDIDKLSNNIINMLKEKEKKDYARGKTEREAHPKCVGLLKAYFLVDKNLPHKYKVGLFKDNKIYPALIRFSNSNPKIKSDKFRDIRGMSIKLIDVKGEKGMEDEKHTQDFVLISMKTIPLGTLEKFHDLIYHITKSNPLVFAINFIREKNIYIIPEMIKNMKHDTSHLDIRYFSTTPYMFGDEIVKYCVVPRKSYTSTLPKKLTNDYLTVNMQKHLLRSEAVFDFMVQFYVNEEETPINDASIPWNREKSPFIKVGEIRIPKQEFTTKERFDLGEKLSFSPGHAMKSHRPVGDLNLGRMKIYKEMSKSRHFRNKESLFEPSKDDFLKM